MKVVLDTNMLVLPFTDKIDVFGDLDTLQEEYGKLEPVVPQLCLLELEKVRPDLYRAVLKLLSKHASIVFIRGDDTDSAILDYCLKYDAALATLDKELLKRAKHLGIKTITVKNFKLR